MRSILLSFIAVVIGGAALAGGLYLRGQLDAPAPEVITVKKAATERGNLGRRPEFWLADPQGVRHAIGEWDGKLLVMNFWATWCPPCRHEMPVFMALQKRYASRGVQFLGIAIDDAAKVRAFAAEIGLNYPTLLGQLDAIEPMIARPTRPMSHCVLIRYSFPETVQLRRPSTSIRARNSIGPHVVSCVL